MSDFDQRMDKLKLRFATRLETEKLLLEQALGSGDRAELKRLAHGLSGSAAIFGYSDIGAAARNLEAAAEVDERLQETAEGLLELMSLAIVNANSRARRCKL
jgi:HPt (histidine-containing phosphotransfer) domain-containing protein